MGKGMSSWECVIL